MVHKLICLILVGIFGTISGGSAWADIGVDEVSLTAGGAVNETNLGSDGMLYISDYAAGQVWVVDPITSGYTRYTDAALASVTDAQAAADGRIWFTNSDTVFGAINRATDTVTTWNIELDEVYFSLSGVAFDAVENTWITETAGGTTPTLHRFIEQDLSFCSYEFTGGSYSDYVIYRGGYLWLANWSRDRIYRFDPISHGVTYWQGPSGFALGMAFDADGNLWWADATAARLRRLAFSPAKVRSYALPVGSVPRMVAAGGGLVWFSEYAGGTSYTVGRMGVLDPLAAVYTEANAAMTTLALPATETCRTLAAGKTAALAVATGALSWSAATWSTVVDAGGWTLYQAPASAKPWGVALAGSYAWIADEGRQLLARTARTEALGAPAVTIEAIPPDVVLSWDAVPGATGYEVCIDGVPYFTAGDASCVAWTELSYPHTNALAGTTNYYYHVLSTAGAQTSPVSNHVAKFAFSLTPGN